MIRKFFQSKISPKRPRDVDTIRKVFLCNVACEHYHVLFNSIIYFIVVFVWLLDELARPWVACSDWDPVLGWAKISKLALWPGPLVAHHKQQELTVRKEVFSLPRYQADIYFVKTDQAVEKGCQDCQKLLTNVSLLPAGGVSGLRQAGRFENFGVFYGF